MNSPIDIKCLSVSIRGLNKSLKRCTFFRWLHHQNCSFVFLQETYSSKECENIWQTEWGSEVFFSHGTNRSKGTMILINPKIKCKVKKKICDKNGRYVILDIALVHGHSSCTRGHLCSKRRKSTGLFFQRASRTARRICRRKYHNRWQF